jgi:type I restriction enzyme S subunit
MIGWENKTLGDLMNIGRGASPRPIQNFITKGPGIPWVKIADATKSINK